MFIRSPDGVQRRRAAASHGSRRGSRRVQQRGASVSSGLAGLHRSRSPLSGMRVLTVHINTEIVFALCHLLGFYFMPRIRDLKDQQLYRMDRESDYGVFTPLLTKTADLGIVEEQ